MGKDVKVDKMKKEDNVKNVNKEKKIENTKKIDEPKFSKVSGKDSKKEVEINKVDNKKKNKTEKKRDKEKSGNKAGFWIGGIGLVIIVLVVVTALILVPKTPEKTVEGMLNSLKNGDFESVNKYVNYDKIANNSEILGSAEMDQETQILLFDKISWKVLNISKEQDTASVEVEITNKDFEKIISNYTQEALKIAFSGESFTEVEQMNKLKEQLKNEEIGTKTVTTTINLNKQNGEWKIQADDNLVNSLLPGLQAAINSLDSIING